MVKLVVDTLPTVPAAPPAAGPDRALELPPPDPAPPAAMLPDTEWPGVAGGDGAVAEEDAARPTETPITEQARATATIHRILLFEISRRTHGRRTRSDMITGVDKSGEDAGGGGAEPGSPELPVTVCPGVAPDTAPVGMVSWGLGGS